MARPEVGTQVVMCKDMGHYFKAGEFGTIEEVCGDGTYLIDFKGYKQRVEDDGLWYANDEHFEVR